MTTRRVLAILCVGMFLTLVIRLLWPSGASRSAIALDDKAIADLNAFVALLDRSPIASVRTAMLALPGAQPKRHGEVFTAVLDKSKQPAVREAAMAGWRHAGTLDADTLSRLLKSDPDEAVRTQAAAEIGKQQIWDAAPALLEAMRDANPRVRAAANVAMGGIIGITLRFDPAAAPPAQDSVIEDYRKQWKGLREYHEMAERLEAAKKKTGK